MVTAILWRRAMVFAFSFIAIGATALAQTENAPSSIYSRLKSVEFVGYRLEATTMEVVIQVYSPEEYAKNVEEKKLFNKEHSKWYQTRDALQKQLNEARIDRTPKGSEVSKTLENEYREFEKTEPNISYNIRSQSFYRVISVGTDYIEISTDVPETTQLIPFHKIMRIIQKKTATKEMPTSAKAN